MAFFMTDDKAPTNAKFKGLLAQILLEGDTTGIAAIGLWNMAGASTQASHSDGLLSIADLVSLVMDRTVAEQLAHALVDAGLWHAEGHECSQCEPVPPKHWRFHDWWQMRYKRGADLRLAWDKAKENKRPEIVEAVWARDCVDPTQPARKQQAKCRYCGYLTKRSDRTSPRGPQLDHVNPRVTAGVRNLVVSCGDCNRAKAAKTPEEAGMTLRPAPRNPEDDVVPPTASLAVAVSPVNSDAETPAERPEGNDLVTPADPVHADAVSPGLPDAETPAENVAVEPTSEPSAEPIGSSQLKAKPKGALAGAPVGAPAQAPGSGPGSGFGLGSGEGSGPGSDHQGDAPPTPRRSKRRRGKGGKRSPQPPPPSPPPPPPQTNPHDAGPSDLIYPPPTGGSPWATWNGPPSAISDENICTVHELHMPCRKCALPEDSR